MLAKKRNEYYLKGFKSCNVYIIDFSVSNDLIAFYARWTHNLLLCVRFMCLLFEGRGDGFYGFLSTFKENMHLIQKKLVLV